MGNILTYLKGRGDQSFAERPFCEVDNLILSELSYWDFGGIVPAVGSPGELTLREASRLYYGKYQEEPSVKDHPQEILKRMASSRRYQNARLSNYVDILDEATQTEFAAIHIALGDGTVYVSFRGTGDHILGWRENFSMSFQRMGAQRLALDYLTGTIADQSVMYRVGGHSKGGNLAVYAATMCPEETQRQILEIYSNDGPGLCADIVEMEKYDKIRPKLIRIVPEFSMIGSLFFREPPTKIVASSAKGIGQHVGISWKVEGDAFCERPRLAAKSQIYNQIFKEWIESVTLDQRKIFTKDFFNALEAGGARKISEIGKGGFDELREILFSMACSESKTKIVIGKLIKSYLHTYLRTALG